MVEVGRVVERRKEEDGCCVCWRREGLRDEEEVRRDVRSCSSWLSEVGIV